MESKTRKFSRKYRPVAASTLKISENKIEWDDNVEVVKSIIDLTSSEEPTGTVLNDSSNKPTKSKQRKREKKSLKKTSQIAKENDLEGFRKLVTPAPITIGRQTSRSTKHDLLRASFQESVPWQNRRQRKPRDSLDSLTSVSDAEPSTPTTAASPSKETSEESELSESLVNEFCLRESWLQSCDREGIMYMFKNVHKFCRFLSNSHGKHKQTPSYIPVKVPAHWSQQQHEQVASWCCLHGFETFWRGGILHLGLRGAYLERMKQLLGKPHETDLPSIEPSYTLALSTPPRESVGALHLKVFEEVGTEYLQATPKQDGVVLKGSDRTHLSSAPSTPMNASEADTPGYRQMVEEDLKNRRESNSSSLSSGSFIAPDVWTEEEQKSFEKAIRLFGPGKWSKIQLQVGTKTSAQCASYYAEGIASVSKGRMKNGVHHRKWNVNVKRAMDGQISAAQSSSMLRRLSVAGAASRTVTANRRKSSIFAIHNLKPFKEFDDEAMEDDDLTAKQCGGDVVSNLSDLLQQAVIEGSESEGEFELNETSEATQIVSDAKLADGLSSMDEALVLSLVLEFLDLRTLRNGTFQVNWSWNSYSRVAINSCSSALLSQALEEGPLPHGKVPASLVDSGALLQCWGGLCRKFPVGSFISEGSYKQVYRVWNSVDDREEAISIMDIAQISDCSNPAVVAKEVSVALLLSELVHNKVCPNFVQTFQVFQFRYAPPVDLWNAPNDAILSDSLIEDPLAEASNKQEGYYQYIRMELCTGGDVEEFIKTLPDELISLVELRAVLFQICYSLLVARDKIALRHYDVKLLNVFIGYHESMESQMKFQLCGREFHVSPSRTTNGGDNVFLIPKLADYGTAVTGTETLHNTVSVDQFTTLENTPIDFLLFHNARDNFEADTFSLGIATIHLFTGSRPYEEILEDVVCPIALIEAWESIWESEDDNKFGAIAQVLADDHDGILYHTLYRYMVLLHGFYSAEDLEYLSSSPIWNAAVVILEGDNKGKGRAKKAMRDCKKTFQNDCKKYSLLNGTEALIVRARQRLDQSPGSMDILRGMLRPRAEDRMRMVDILLSDYFEPMSEALTVPSEISEELSFTSFAESDPTKLY